MDNDSNQIEEIKNRLDIVQIVGKYVTLKQAGKNFSGLCPFHHEKTPSFIVSPDIQRYKCFGCGESGDIFNFVQKIENLDFPETLNKLAKEAGVELKQFKKNPKYTQLEDINYAATKYFYNSLKKDKVASKYVAERGFNETSIKNFGLGYAPKYPNLLTYISKYHHYNNNELINSGLFTLKNGKIKEKFYDRIMFPIRSSKGDVIGFTGRILPGNDYGPKYMNSPETTIFHKKNNLFGQYESRQEIRKQDLAILCEGSTDVISSHQNGIKNIVAPLGTGLTKEQLENLSHLTKNMLFFFDSDEAGQKAVIRAFKLASELNLYPYATNSSPYKDIDEMLQKEPLKFKTLIQHKKEAFSYILINYLKDKNLSKMQDLIKAKLFVEELLAPVKDFTLYTHYSEIVMKLSGFSVKIPNISSKSPFISGSRPKKFLVKSETYALEQAYIQLLIFSDKNKDKYYIPSRYISDETLQNLYRKIKNLNPKTISETVTIFNNDNAQKAIIEEIILNSTEIDENIDEQIKKLIKRLHYSYLKQKQKNISFKLAQAEEMRDNEKIKQLSKHSDRITKLLKAAEDD